MIKESKLTTGQILGGRYRIIRVIGSGGMSHVHLAEDLRLPGKRWAVKESVTEGLTAVSVQAEAELLISLSHSRLPRITDFYPPDEEGYSYLVMDYIEGITLAEFMAGKSGPVPVATLLQFAVQLLEVLHYLHGHNPPIVYRDMKPSNIMIKAQGELVLIDFGIARSYRNGRTEDTVKLGTVGFAAPEQYGSGQSGPESDLYGLGAILLYMATGGKYSQWRTGIDRDLRGMLPAGLITVIGRLLRHHPEERYPDAASVLHAIYGIEEGNIGTGSSIGASAIGPVISRTNHTKTVAVMGVAHGLGTTHTSLAVCSCLSRHGKTAWVDLAPGSPTYNRLLNMFDPANEADAERNSGQPFWLNSVHYWKGSEGGSFLDLPIEDYEYVVLDMGVGRYEGALEQLASSNAALLIASGADWRLEETMLWIRRCGLPEQPRWRVCLPFAGHASVALLQGVLKGCQTAALPAQSNPFKVEGKLVQVLGEVVKEIITDKSGSKKGIFHKKRPQKLR